MASFESVLHKTASQVKTARLRLAERSGLDGSRQVDAARSSPSSEPHCAPRSDLRGTDDVERGPSSLARFRWHLPAGKVMASVTTTFGPPGLEGLR